MVKSNNQRRAPSIYSKKIATVSAFSRDSAAMVLDAAK